MASLINYIILGISLCLGVAKNILSKAGEKEFSNMGNLMSVNIITALTAVVFFFLQGIHLSEALTVRFVVMAALYGLFTLGSQSLYITAVKDGSVSVCSLIYASSFLLPTLLTAIYYNEPVTVLKAIGIIVMLISIFLVSFKGNGHAEPHNKKYLIPAFLAMCSAGSVGILQKIFGHTYNGRFLNEYLFTSFLFMFIFSFIVKTSLPAANEKMPFDKRFYILAFILSISIVAANKLNLYLVGVLPGLIFFPFVNGACVVLSAILSRLLFKEKISSYGVFGILIGVAAIVIISI